MTTHMLFRFARGNPEGSKFVATAQGATRCGRLGIDMHYVTEIPSAVTCGNCRKSMVGRARVPTRVWEAWLEVQAEKAAHTARAESRRRWPSG